MTPLRWKGDVCLWGPIEVGRVRVVESAAPYRGRSPATAFERYWPEVGGRLVPGHMGTLSESAARNVVEDQARSVLAILIAGGS